MTKRHTGGLLNDRIQSSKCNKVKKKGFVSGSKFHLKQTRTQ